MQNDLGNNLRTRFATAIDGLPILVKYSGDIRMASPVEVSEGFAHMLCPSDHFDNALAQVGKDAAVARAYTPSLGHWSLADGKLKAITPTRARNASYGTRNQNGSYWGNFAEKGSYDQSRFARELWWSYGSDHSMAAGFDLWTGESVPCPIPGTANSSGYHGRAKDNAANWLASGVAPYEYGPAMRWYWRTYHKADLAWQTAFVTVTQLDAKGAPISGTGTRIGCRRLGAGSTVTSRKWVSVYDKAFDAFTMLAPGTLDEAGNFIFWAATADGKVSLCRFNVTNGLLDLQIPTLYAITSGSKMGSLRAMLPYYRAEVQCVGSKVVVFQPVSAATSHARLWCFDISTGKLLWSETLADGLMGGLALTDEAAYVVKVSNDGGKLKLNVGVRRFAGGFSVVAVTTPITTLNPSLFKLLCVDGLLLAQVDTGLSSQALVGIEGDSTPQAIPAELPMSVRVAPIDPKYNVPRVSPALMDFTPPEDLDSVVVKPLEIGTPDPTTVNTSATEPKHAWFIRVPKISAASVRLELTMFYIDDSRSIPGDVVIREAGNNWSAATITRRNRPAIGAEVGRANVGAKTPCGYVRLAVDLTEWANRQIGPATLAIPGSMPPNYAMGPNWIVADTRLVASSAPSVPVETQAKFEQVIDLATTMWNVGSAGSDRVHEWIFVPGGQQVHPADGFNYSTSANAEKNAPCIVYRIDVPAAGRYEISLAGKGIDATKDSVFIGLDHDYGQPLKQVDSFTAQGSTRVVGTFELAAGVHVVSVYARECGTILQSIKVREV